MPQNSWIPDQDATPRLRLIQESVADNLQVLRTTSNRLLQEMEDVAFQKGVGVEPDRLREALNFPQCHQLRESQRGITPKILGRCLAFGNDRSPAASYAESTCRSGYYHAGESFVPGRR